MISQSIYNCCSEYYVCLVLITRHESLQGFRSGLKLFINNYDIRK